MDCPVCEVPLIAVEREGIEIDWCPDCRGLWFDEGELELLAEKSGRRADAGQARPLAGAGGGSRRCPRCRRRLEAAALGPGDALQLDRCERHGLWLDRGELGRLMGRLAAGDGAGAGPILEFLGEVFGGAEGAPQRGRQP